MESLSEYVIEKTQEVKEFLGLSQYDKMPEIEDSKKKLKLIEQRYVFLQQQISIIFSLIPQTVITSNKLADILVQADRKNGLKSRTLVNTIQLFFETLGEDAKDILMKQYEGRVFITLKEQEETISLLKSMKEERHKIRLLAASYRQKADSMAKIGDPTLLTKMKMLQKEKEEELEKISKRFVKCVNRLWDHRNQLIEQPMQQLVGIVFNYCKCIYPALQVLMNSVTREDLLRDYLKDVN